MVNQYNVPEEEVHTTYEILKKKEGIVLPITECDWDEDVERDRLLREKRVSARIGHNLEFARRDSQ